MTLDDCGNTFLQKKGGPCMKRLLTAAVLCTVLILGSVWSVRAVDNTAQAVALDVENDRLNEAWETWDAAQTLLGALLLHSEIDQADRLFDRVLAAQQNGLTDEFSLDRAELLAQLRHLPEVQRPTLKICFLRQHRTIKAAALCGNFVS